MDGYGGREAAWGLLLGAARERGTAVGLLILGVSVFFLFRSGLFGEGVAFGFQ